MKMFAFLQIAREKEKAEHMETIYLSFDHLSPWVKLNCHSSGPQCIFKEIVKGAFPSNLDMIFFSSLDIGAVLNMDLLGPLTSLRERQRI